MRYLLIIIAALSLAITAKSNSAPDIYSTDFWEIKGKPGYKTWIEIHNSKEAKSSGTAHISVHARKEGSPVWSVIWLKGHIAITTDTLVRSVIAPIKERMVYPERFYEEYEIWKKDDKKGTAIICSTSLSEFLK